MWIKISLIFIAFLKIFFLFTGGTKSCNHCSEEDSVCSMEGCVKFNPFYVREMREKSSGLLRFESGPDNSKTMSGNMGIGHGAEGGHALCGVVLDAVFHAGQVIKIGQTESAV